MVVCCGVGTLAGEWGWVCVVGRGGTNEGSGYAKL